MRRVLPSGQGVPPRESLPRGAQAAGQPRPAVVIRPLVTDADHLGLLAVLHDWYGIDTATLSSRLDAVRQGGWQGVGMFASASGRLLGVAGWWIETRLCHGRYLYVDHFVVIEAQRRLGLGRELLAYLGRLARQQRCERIILDVARSNEAAQAFWQREGFTAVGLHCSRACG